MGSSQSAALTIYRIGGDNFPEPDPDALGAPADSVQFRPLPWDQTDEAPFGSSHLVEIQPDSIRPQFMPGDLNLIQNVLDTGGTINAWDAYSGFQFEAGMEVMWDGDFQTYYPGDGQFIGGQGAPYCGTSLFLDGFDNYDGRCKYIWVTLPGVFPLHSIRVSPPPGTEEVRYIPTYTLGFNDGDPLKLGFRDREIRHMQATRVSGDISVDFDVFTEVLDNTSGVLEFELEGKPAQNIVFVAEMGSWWIAEFEVYAKGFAVSSNYTSEVIDLEQPATLGPLTWSGELHPGATVDLQVRTGDTPDPNIYYRNTFRGAERSRYDAEGTPLGRAAYLRLEEGEQRGVAPDLERWSAWSSPLAFGDLATEFGAARPRRYVQFRVDFHSGGRLDYLQFPVTQPQVVARAVAEIEPERVAAREATRFTYYLRPEIRAGDLGFDRIRIATPTRVDSVESVTIAGVPLEESQWQATVDSTSFVVHIPRRDDRATRDEIEIVFHSRVFDYGTVFDGWISDSSRPWEVGQRLEPGDAVDFPAENNSLTVELIDVGQQVLDEIELSTGVFTPNADGVNDRLDIGFDLVNLSAAVPVKLEVFDLAGTRRAELPLARLGSGPHSVSWDGTDDRGRLLVPGLYVLRLDVATDDATFTASRVVSVAY